MIIKTQEKLEQICHTLAQKPFITIDTEFLRDKTYYSQLCLIQVCATDMDAVAIDPLAEGIDLTPFYTLMQDKNVLKVFHAARQDIEIFYQLSGHIPAPLFDTQVASMVCGFGEQIAYARLVEDVTGRKLSKNAQFTDWARRPLNDKQLTYALDDVIYLRDVYAFLSRELQSKGREDWVLQEMDILNNPETYDQTPMDSWQRIKIRSDKPQVLAVLQRLAAWREDEAQRRNLPRNRILKDEALADIALYMPRDADAFNHIRSVPKDFGYSKNGTAFLKLIDEALKSPKDTWPRSTTRDSLPKHLVPLLEMLKLLLKINAADHDVAAKLIASADDLQDIAQQDLPDHKIFKGWRDRVFGQDARALKSGQLLIGFENGKIIKRTP